MKKLSHLDKNARAVMVDVSAKEPVWRTARAQGSISMAPATVALITKQALKKGDVLCVAEIAGIQAAKRTSDLIPLCHPLPLTKISVKAVLSKTGVNVNSEVTCLDRTGVEMEALTAVSVALLTIYDMCKAVDKKMIIENVFLKEKTKSSKIK